MKYIFTFVTKIALKALQSNIPHILLFSFLSLFCLQNGFAQDIKPKTKPIPLLKDKKSSLKKDSLLLKKKLDTVKIDTIVKPKSAIESKITHNALDYILQNAKTKQIELYNQAHVTYEDIDLKAGYILIDNKKNTLFAKGIKDSLGYTQRPVFKQGSQESEQDSILYNFKTRRTLIYNIKTNQSGMITYGEKMKKVNDSTIFLRNIKFTTSDKIHPDYYIKSRKAKLVPGKKIIVGLSNLVVADVPTPIAIPFAYFPMTDKRASGFIIPTWGQTSSQGYFLQNGGYYLALNDYLDISLMGDVYTNGSWGLRSESSYVVRYKYNGNFSLRYENLIRSVKGFDDYSKSANFNVQWSHNQDVKSNPNARFSASVNLGSSKYFRESLNEVNSNDFLTNTLSSSISYYKKFVGTPFNLNATASHSQNTNTQKITMTLPSLQVNMDRVYPFAGKGGIKKNALQKVGLNYSMKGDYRINTVDSLFFKPEMFKTAKAGVQHTASANTNMKVLKYFTLSPSANFKEVWNWDYINRYYDATSGTAIKDTVRGFKSFREYSAGVSLGTTIYGQFNFKGRLKSIRHTMRPSITYGYRPDFADKYNQQVQQSIDPTDILTYSPFENGIYGSPGAGLSNSIGINISNVLEAKIASKDSLDTEDKKITLLNNLNFSTSYNIAADSLKWSPVSMNAGTRFFKDKLSINFGATLDPYQIDTKGNRINKINSSIFRLTSANISANVSFSSKDFEKKEKATSNNTNQNQFGSSSTNTKNKNNKDVKETKLYNATIPWNINIAYAVNYSNYGISNSGIGSNSLMFNGDLELSPKWKVRYSSGYDFKNKGFTYTRLGFTRDLDSWSFNFDWSPFGTNKSYYFRIGVNSSMLSDLKWDKRNLPDRLLF
ncbi:putative LPS assembly protein LptD [Polaribacter huanghezhanensis]|uniref:putative LPS assembly protein LptD n=1 Tax=Polaribacter huanghezhanensis TaxID=1354726 RepID=UPI002647D2BD|nr:putative LPS assembly protein LptD [Polaribacter huanghezhanensis]